MFYIHNTKGVSLLTYEIPILMAAQAQSADIVTCLVEKGADAMLQDDVLFLCIEFLCRLSILHPRLRCHNGQSKDMHGSDTAE